MASTRSTPRKPGLGRGNGQLFRFGSVKPEVAEEPVKEETSQGNGVESACLFCNRKPQQILCRACGHCFHGRVRGSCSSHPGIIHLMDYQVCPNCLSASLKEFTASPTPRAAAVPEVSPCKGRSVRSRQDSWHEQYASPE